MILLRKRECYNYPRRRSSGVHFGPGPEDSSEPTGGGRQPWHRSDPTGVQAGLPSALCTAYATSAGQALSHLMVSCVAGTRNSRPNDGLCRILLVLWFPGFHLVQYCLSTNSHISSAIRNPLLIPNGEGRKPVCFCPRVRHSGEEGGLVLRSPKAQNRSVFSTNTSKRVTL